MTPDRSPALVRNRRNRVFGGVCAGVAERLDVDPLLVRLLTVLLVLFSGGAVALVYVALWVLLPEAAPEPAALEAVPPAAPTTAAEAAPGAVHGAGSAAAQPPALAAPAGDYAPGIGTEAAAGTGGVTGAEPAAVRGADPRGAWTAVGGELRGLAGELRRSRPTDTTAAPPADTDPRPAPLKAADRAVSSVGERLRQPGVQASARQVATRLSDAVRVSADELGRRTRRG